MERHGGLRIVIDVDDTICRVAVKGDYANAEEIERMTSRIREMKAAGHTVILHTARGMVSCGGDVEKAKEKNRAVLVAWLAKHEVPYDEILWGKPYADVYIDDKAVGAEELMRKGVTDMEGFSGARVTRVGGMVVKQAEDVDEQARWYEEAYRRAFPYKTPKVYSCNMGRLYMEHVGGRRLADMSDIELTDRIANVMWEVVEFHKEEVLEGDNDVDWYKGYVGDRAEEIGLRRAEVEEDVERAREWLRKRTFCHGDLTMSNIIIGDGGVVLIDPSPKKVSSYLLDASKLWASLRGLDDVIQGRERRIRVAALERMRQSWLNEEWDEEEWKAVEMLERGHWIRVARYAKVLGRQEVFERLMDQIREWYGQER